MPRQKLPRILLVCDRCSKPTREVTERDYERLYANREYICQSCSSREKGLANREKSSERMKSTMAKMTPEERSANGKYGRSCVKLSGSDLVKRQYASIKSDPEQYKKYCEKRRQISIDFHASLSEEEKEKFYRNVFKGNNVSKGEIEFFKILEDNDIHCEYQKCISGLFPDGVIENKKIIIEYFGDIYHCNPKQFTDKLQYCSWISRTVEEQWKNDKKRLAILYKMGYTVIIVWESDWKNDKLSCIDRIIHAVNIN